MARYDGFNVMRGGAGFAKVCGSLGWLLLRWHGLGGGEADGGEGARFKDGLQLQEVGRDPKNSFYTQIFNAHRLRFKKSRSLSSKVTTSL